MTVNVTHFRQPKPAQYLKLHVTSSQVFISLARHTASILDIPNKKELVMPVDHFEVFLQVLDHRSDKPIYLPSCEFPNAVMSFDFITGRTRGQLAEYVHNVAKLARVCSVVTKK